MRSSSAIILDFEKARQELKIEEEIRRFTEIFKFTQERRSRREKLFSANSLKKTVDLTSAIQSAERYKTMDEHRIDLPDLFSRLSSNPEIGLDDHTAFERLQKFGENILTLREKTPWYIKLLKEFTASFSLLIWVGAFFCFLSYIIAPDDPSNLYLGLALILVIVFTAFESFYQTAKSESILDSFKNFIPPMTTCLRNGKFQTLPAAKLVPGDIIKLKSGDKVPADIRILSSAEMKVDNSSLTGESDPLLRSPECTNKENPLETANLAFFGTLCKEGAGSGIVISTGDTTILGQIANLASNAGNSETTLTLEMRRLVQIVGLIAFVTGTFFFIMGFVLGYPAVTNLSFGVGVLTAYVPGGLATSVVVGLAMTAKRLARKKVLVKNVNSVETLGSATCICSDKTGTLTQNKMTVERLWYGGKEYKGKNLQKLKGKDVLEYDTSSVDFISLQEIAVLCSEATFDNAIPSHKLDVLLTTAANKRDALRKKIEDEHHKNLEKMLWLDRPVIGDASEAALVKFYQAVQDIEVIRSNKKIKKMNDGSEAKIMFNSAWKYALTIVDDVTQDSDNCVMIKGAPEKIWTFCTSIMNHEGKAISIDAAEEAKFLAINRKFAEAGERVLGFAKLHLPRNKYPSDFQFNCKNPFETNFPMHGFTFVGLISLIDPPRDSVPDAILKCKTAGIKVIMVTGDQPITATAIARQVHIFTKDEKTVNQIAEEKKCSIDQVFDEADALVIHGDMIMQAVMHDELLPEEKRGKEMLRWLEKPRIVFARTTPAQKLIIVKACQQQGHVVAVTGDGVNDSPAIKKADIGIAMGVVGSDVAKDAADMILMTDDFAAIIVGVEEGRKIFDNIKRCIVYTMAANVCELLPFLSLIIFGLPLPLSSILILCIDLGFNIVPSISWASEHAELDIMIRQPRRKHTHLVDRKLLAACWGVYGVMQSIGTFLTYYVIMQDFGFKASQLVGIGVAQGFYPNTSDVFDPNAAFYGHTSPKFIEYCTNCWDKKGECDLNKLERSQMDENVDWLYAKDMQKDLRLIFLQCEAGGVVSTRIDWGECLMKQISVSSGLPICFTTESVKNAQTGVYFSIMLAQLTSMIVIKTRRQSLMTASLDNFQQFFGWAWMLAFIITVGYCFTINNAFNSRQITFLHFGWQSVGFNFLMLAYDEIRKYYLRKGTRGSKANWFERNTYW